MATRELAEDAGSALAAASRQPHAAGSRWRALLEARWQDRLQEVTELSLAFHEAGAQSEPDRQPGSLQRLMRQTVAARRALADTDEALGRLSAGRFGQCERCSGPIPPASLSRTPEWRYCPPCG
jgi:DnaK suppressor protein